MKELFQAIPDILFDVFGDVLTDITITQHGDSSSYDVATDAITAGQSTSPIKGFEELYLAREVDGTVVKVNDRRFWVKCKDVPFKLETDDIFTIGADIYKVVNAVRDPAEAAWIVQVRL